MPKLTMLLIVPILLMCSSLFVYGQDGKGGTENHRFKISFGNSGRKAARVVTLKSYVPGVIISNIVGNRIESNDKVGIESRLGYGAGDADELIFNVSWKKPSAELLKINERAKMWRYLMEHGSPGQIQRLRQDPWNKPDAPLVTVELNTNGTEGFSVPLELLLKHRAMWLPEHDVFLTTADDPVDFRQHVASLKGERVLDSIKARPDATLAEFGNLWEDFGNPKYDVPWQTKHMGTTGHLIITTAAHGSVYKFAVDRWGRVRPDFASPYKFRLDPEWEGSQWKAQVIENGLPLITTMLEKGRDICELQQFASPLKPLDAAGGSVPSVFFTRMKFSGNSKPVNFKVHFSNEMPDRALAMKEVDGHWYAVDKESDDILLAIESRDTFSLQTEFESYDKGQKITISIIGEASGDSAEILLKLPSPAIPFSRRPELEALEFSAAKARMSGYWEDWINRGASFEVPEPAVNELFRANLWHALVLPRHTIDNTGKLHMDLPYANTAYGQKNSDWPINQAVYVDYMIYGLRGYEEVAKNEIAAMFQTQQQADGRIGGFANWGVYTPGHLYAIAQNFLLSGNREHFESLLPNSLRALDWCVDQLDKAQSGQDRLRLIRGPLNDLSHGEREWAFTQAYYVGGLALFSKALAEYKHPRAEDLNRINAEMKTDVVNAFARSSVKSSVVQLADGTWTNYVPTDATTPRRMLDEWYPTDVDTGPLHLARLGALAPHSWLTTAMLHDHEDNLFLQNKGAANEPVYVQQANAYLLRDEPKAVIRSFYSMMASAFSHSQYSPLEHRWAHGQYYGPPSTDGAWFEIYRKMLVNEWGEDTLMIGQAIPRAWLDSGKRIEVEDAPTYFGNISFTIEGESKAHEITAKVERSNRKPPTAMLVRFRHPDEKPIRSVVVNGIEWKNYNIEKEYIIIPNPAGRQYTIIAQY